MRYFSLILTLILVFNTVLLNAQNPLGAPLVLNYGKVLFNGGSRTWDIAQDSRGIMYFGNNEGLISFNGKYWKQYKLPNQTILRSIYIDEKDRIFVGGQGEFGYFEKSEFTGLRYISLNELIPPDFRQFADVWHTVAFEQGVYFMTSDFIYCYKGGRITVYPTSSEWYFMEVANGKLYAQDRSHGLLRFANNQWGTMIAENQFGKGKVSGMLTIGKDSVLVNLQNNKSFLLSSNKLTALNSSSWLDMYTPSLAKVDKDKYVIATSTNGCQIRKNSGELIEQIAVTEGLQNKNVTTVFVDKQQNIWAAIDNAISLISYGGGIRYLRPNINHEVMGYSVRVFENKLYLSSSNGVYAAKLDTDVKDQSLSPSTFSLVKGSDGGEAWRLDEINGRLLLAHNRGMYTIKGDRIEPIALNVGSWLTLPLQSVFPIRHSVVGTYYGLNLLGFDGQNFFLEKSLNGLMDSYRFLVQDDKGVLFSSHPYRGIYRIVLDGSLESYETELLTVKDGLPSSNQNYVFKLKNRVAIATENGVYEYDEKKGKFTESAYFSSFKGLALKYMVDDKEGNIWFCSGKKIGVAIFDQKLNNYKILFFPEIEGMNTLGFDNIYPFDAENIYVGSEKGAIHINFRKYKAGRAKPTVLLSSVRSIGEKDSIIFDGFDPPFTTLLSATYNSLHFEYASSSFGIHENVVYSYWLEGNDTSWSSWSQNTEKDYTNLSNGKYTFKVKAKNNLNEESDILEYVFVIKPPWYKTSLAYLIYIILILIIICIAVIFQKHIWIKQQIKFEDKMKQLRYIHQLEVEKNEKEIVKLQNEKLENEVQSKTKELASTSMQLMENSGALVKLRIALSKLDTGGEESDIKKITSLLKDVDNNASHWDQFASHFDELNDSFFSRLKSKHPTLSRNDLKVCAYLRLNFTTKQIAQLQSISVRGAEIHRYRLRKKLAIPTVTSVNTYLESI